MSEGKNTALDRVKSERDDLEGKILKLNNLLGKVKSDNWEAHQKLLDSLSNEQKKLLRKQLKVMKEYKRVLDKRIEIWFEE